MAAALEFAAAVADTTVGAVAFTVVEATGAVTGKSTSQRLVKQRPGFGPGVFIFAPCQGAAKRRRPRNLVTSRLVAR